MTNNLYQPQPLKIEYGNLAQNINREELENSVKNPVERNRLFQLISGVKDHVEPAMNALGNVIFGKPSGDNISIKDGEIDATVSNARKGGLIGFIGDFGKGLDENYTQDFRVDNLYPKENKGFAYRLGEAAGTLTKGLSGPLGDAWVAGYNGMPAAMERQNVRVADKVYRDDLEKMGVDTSGIKGYISEDMYKNILASRQMQENAEWRKANLLAQQQQNDTLNNIRLRELNIKENEAKRGKPLSDSQVKELKSTSDFVNSLDNIISRYSDAKYDNMFGIKGDIRRNNPLSRYDAEASLFKQDVEILRQRYAKLLEGGRLSDSDRAFYQKALFNPNVSRADFLEAVRRMKQTLIQDYNNSLSLYSKQGKDIEGFELANEVGTITTNNAQPKTNDLPNVDVSAIDAELKRRGVL